MRRTTSERPDGVLCAENVVAGYGRSSRPVLHGVSAQIARGSITGIIGPNGGGKSTLLRCLAGAIRPTEGRVAVGEWDDLSRVPPRRLAAQIAFVPQENPAPFAFTVAELVGLGANSSSRRDGLLPERIAQALDLMELAPLAHRSLAVLSGGERQRAALARAFAQNAPFLLLDEPTAHLDLRHEAALFTALREKIQTEPPFGVGIVLHDLNRAAAVADELLLIAGGRVIAQGAPAAVLTEDILSAVYQTPVRVVSDPVTGGPRVYAVDRGLPTPGDLISS